MILAHLERFVAAAVSAAVGSGARFVHLIVPSEFDAERAAAEARSLLGKEGERLCVHIPGFTQAGVFRYESARRVVAKRLGAMEACLRGQARLVVTSARGLARVAPSEQWFQHHSRSLEVGQELDPDAFLEGLERLCYLPVQRVEEVGEFCVRGSIIDFWTPGQTHPTRLELFGETLEHMRSFRAGDQRSFVSLESVVVLPAREFVWPAANDLSAAIDRLNSVTLAQGVGGRVRSDLFENLQNSVPFAGIDDAFPAFVPPSDVGSLENLLDVAATKAGRRRVVFLAGPLAGFEEVVHETTALYEGALASGVGKGILVPRLGDVFPSWEVGRLPGALDALSAVASESAEVAQLYTPPGDVNAALEPLVKSRFAERAQALSSLVEENKVSRVLLTCESDEGFAELAGLLARYLPEFGELSVDAAPTPFPLSAFFEVSAFSGGKEGAAFRVSPRFFAARARLDAGFFLPPGPKETAPSHETSNGFGKNSIEDAGTLVVTESWLRGVVRDTVGDVFDDGASYEDAAGEGGGEGSAPGVGGRRARLGESVAASRQAAEMLMQAQFGDFTEGDLVVHVQYGIARFRGLVTVKLMDITGDFLALEYAGADKVYVPVHKFNLVQKYVGASRDDDSVLDSLKKGEWEKRKQRARAEVEKLAKELLEHQARRATTPGHAFGKPGEDWMAFCSAFPYDETPDQLKAVSEIMADMARPKAMDRLLVGDVGFGKTEVAFRAAFRCVLDGKQVAWLVPTTVLAHQHFRSALERFKGFGVEIEVIDRAVTAGAQSKVLEKVAQGKVDILIGTHRILSKDVAFRDLGLLVVDEEQRFGVLQKEKIKQMSYGVDVLTMTATPIPRTLQMAMIGLRELSLLTTPPKARLAVKTFVCPHDEAIIQTAISQELARGGQVFYVHNRVEDLDAVEGYLKALVPQARICVGHGKMSQKELDATIIKFLEGHYDLLLCTTIIESGIDMPGVNTILVQNADFFGLAQLYQLRGRVGRRSTRGYAYFLTSGGLRDEDEGARRLDILKEHQDLGSGFIIASHDLEMRGSGSVLGDDQSGRVGEVGLETYTQMLDDAIRQLGGMKVSINRDVEIQLPLNTQIPEDYISNARERLRVYRRFFGARTEGALGALVEECEDRFGPLPETVKNLSELARLRRWLVTINALSLTVGDECTELRLSKDVLQASGDDSAEQLFKRILDVCNRHMKGVRLTPDGKLLFNLRKRHFQPQNVESALKELKRLLSLLAGEAHEVSSG